MHNQFIVHNLRKISAMLLNIRKLLDNNTNDIIDTSHLNSQKVELSMSSSVKKSFVTRNGTHFCYKCGWIDSIEVTMERKEYTDSDGKTDISYFFIDTDRNLECPDCKRRTVKPLTTGNTVHAVEYLLRALR